MEGARKKARSPKEQMQLDRMATLDALDQAIARDSSNVLASVTFRVVWRLLTYMGEEGLAFPAMATLALALGLHERTVRDHLDRAVAAGFLRKKRDGRLKTNVYSLAMDHLVRQSERVVCADNSEVIGSRAPVTLTQKATMEATDRSLRSSEETAQRCLPLKVNGSVAQSHRANSSKITGSCDPTIHLEKIHEENPRQQEGPRDARQGARTRPCVKQSGPSFEPASRENAGPSNREDGGARAVEDLLAVLS